MALYGCYWKKNVKLIMTYKFHWNPSSPPPLHNFKNVKDTHGRVLLLVKLQASKCNFTKSNNPPWVFTNGTISRKSSHMFAPKYLKMSFMGTNIYMSVKKTKSESSTFPSRLSFYKRKNQYFIYQNVFRAHSYVMS